MRTADELVANRAKKLSWESMMTLELAEEIIERSLTADEFRHMVDALDDGVFEIVMSYRI